MMNHISLSQIFALIGTLFLTFVFVLSIRSKLLASFFHGLHRIYQIHHLFALIGIALILLHVFLEVASIGGSLNSLIILFSDFSLITAWIALLIFILVSFFSWIIEKPRSWRKFHLATIFAWPILYWHFRDFSNEGLHKILVILFYTIGLIAIFRDQVLMRLPFWGKKYKVKSLQKINNNTFELTITPSSKNILKINACAQFCYLRFNQMGFSKQWHPFTCLTHPEEDSLDLKFAIKSLGHDTQLIDKNLIGTIINVDGPYGDLHNDKFKKELWFVSGVAISALYSWSKDKDFAKYPTRVIYFYNNAQDQIYPEYWSDLKNKKTNLDQRLWESSVRGLIDTKALDNLLINFEDADVFIAGSRLFIKHVRKLLKSKSISVKYIHSEEFLK